ncbi:MAG: hypothetical protein IRY88_17945 [Rubrobacteraceae bacterium]|nr:hypothetical protein [Rubrobacteraceae bacterium]
MSLPRLRRCEGYLILDGTIRDAVELLDLALARTRASRGRDERLTEEVTEILLDARERLLAVAGGGMRAERTAASRKPTMKERR